MSGPHSSLQHLPCAISVDVDGQAFVGSFTVGRLTIKVAYGARTGSAQLRTPRSEPDGVARAVLGQLVIEAAEHAP